MIRPGREGAPAGRMFITIPAHPPWPNGDVAVDLAMAVAEDQRLSARAGHVVVARRAVPPDIEPGLAVVGVTDAHLTGSLAILAGQVETALPHLRYISVNDAVGATVPLAQRVTASVDPAWLDTCQILAIPRGGQLVATLLAYRLGIPRGRCHAGSAPPGSGPVLLVDDIAVSGARLRAALEDIDGRSVVAATLASPPPLREAVVATVPRVVAFVSAFDMTDRTADFAGPAGLDDYRRRWQTEAEGYWTGRTDPVVFEWSEPESSWRNPVTGQPEPGWKLLPPAMCLGNRGRDDGDRPPVLLHRQPAGSLLAVQDDVLLGDAGESTVIAVPSEGSWYGLSGTSHTLFWALADSDDSLAEVAQATARSFDVAPDELEGDLRELVASLAEAGIVGAFGG